MRQVRLDVYANPAPGAGQYVTLRLGSDCSGALVGDVNPGGIGLQTVTFDPGVGVPANSALSVVIGGGQVGLEAYTDGYTVAAGAVPAAAASGPSSTGPQQH